MRNTGKAIEVPGEGIRRDFDENAIRQSGRGLTPLRQRVLDALVGSGYPLGAYELARRLSAPGHPVLPVTVYRTLAYLIEVGLAHRIASRNVFVARVHRESAQVATLFLICRVCGCVSESTSEVIKCDVEGLANTIGFRRVSRNLEVEGECATCAEDKI